MTTEPCVLLGAICELSARPSGEICRGIRDVRLIQYECVGQLVKRYVCMDCREKMLRSETAW